LRMIVNVVRKGLVIANNLLFSRHFY